MSILYVDGSPGVGKTSSINILLDDGFKFDQIKDENNMLNIGFLSDQYDMVDHSKCKVYEWEASYLKFHKAMLKEKLTNEIPLISDRSPFSVPIFLAFNMIVHSEIGRNLMQKYLTKHKKSVKNNSEQDKILIDIILDALGQKDYIYGITRDIGIGLTTSTTDWHIILCVSEDTIITRNILVLRGFPQDKKLNADLLVVLRTLYNWLYEVLKNNCSVSMVVNTGDYEEFCNSLSEEIKYYL